MTASKPSPQSPKRGRVFEKVRAALLESIRAKELQPGDRLPSERSLAESHGVSRSAVREALRTLESSGVLRFEKGQSGGAFVREHSADGITQSFRDMILLGEMPFSELVRVRLALLQLAVELAAERAQEADFAALDANIDELAQAIGNGDRLGTIQPVMTFNTLLGKASHNPVLSLVIDMLVQLMVDLLTSLALPTYIDLVQPRRQIVKMLRERRGEDARALLSEHLSQTTEYVLRHAKLNGEPI